MAEYDDIPTTSLAHSATTGRTATDHHSNADDHTEAHAAAHAMTGADTLATAAFFALLELFRSPI